MADFTIPCSLTKWRDTYPFISPQRFAGSLAGQVAIITGAGRGIGRATALALAAAGASICAVARTQTEIDSLVDEIKSKHSTAAMAIAADVVDSSAAARVVAEAQKVLGAVNILINNAGTARLNPFEREDLVDHWWRAFEVNFRGAINFTHAVLPVMLQQGHGTIISTSSAAGILHIPFNSAYSTSKAALIKFHQELDLEIRDRGIRSFTLHPGLVHTTMAQADGAINYEAVSQFPRMAKTFEVFSKLEFDTVELGANTFVALCADRRTDVLCGKYIDCQFDLEEVIKEVEKGEGNAVDSKNLYRLKLDEL